MKVFLAGTSGEEKNIDIIRASPYILESFYYIKPWQYELIHTSKMFLLDSGAFTFFSNGKNLNWNDYLIKYAEFINKYDVKYFFELDIDDLIGYENVKKLRQKLTEYTGKKPIPVWHISRGKQNYIDMCKEFDYVAIGGLVGVEIKSRRQKLLEKSFPWFIDVAHKNNAKLHALGYTKVKMFEQYHFDYANDAMNTLFAFNLRISVASAAMYFVANMADVYIFNKLKEKMNGRALWLRNNVSTILCNCLENFGFIGLAFWGIYDLQTIITIAASTSIIELIVALLDTPFLYMARKIKKE